MKRTKWSSPLHFRRSCVPILLWGAAVSIWVVLVSQTFLWVVLVSNLLWSGAALSSSVRLALLPPPPPEEEGEGAPTPPPPSFRWWWWCGIPPPLLVGSVSLLSFWVVLPPPRVDGAAETWNEIYVIGVKKTTVIQSWIFSKKNQRLILLKKNF